MWPADATLAFLFEKPVFHILSLDGKIIFQNAHRLTTSINKINSRTLDASVREKKPFFAVRIASRGISRFRVKR